MKLISAFLTLFLAFMFVACSSQSANGISPDATAVSPVVVATDGSPVAMHVILPPLPDPLQVLDLKLSNDGQTLSWSYTHPGDYNQDGWVYVSDVALLGIHFGHAIGVDPYDQVADGDGNGMVALSDLAILGGHFGVDIVTGYCVEGKNDGGFAQVGQVALNQGSDARLGRQIFTYHIPAGPYTTFRVRPKLLLDDVLGAPSNEVTMP